ncbi:MAG TPA: hypothetical protein VFZ40_18545, partial [Pyrinomonadaceae bacterium]
RAYRKSGMLWHARGVRTESPACSGTPEACVPKVRHALARQRRAYRKSGMALARRRRAYRKSGMLWHAGSVRTPKIEATRTRDFRFVCVGLVTTAPP